MGLISRILRILCNILSILVGIVLVFSLYAWIQITFMKESYASIMGYSVFEVATGSMTGTIEIDDYIIVQRSNDIKINDIITFNQEGTFVTHRVVEIKGNEIITKGDANNSEDISISYGDVIGKVILVIPRAGILKDVLMEPKILVMVFITLILFTVFFSIEEKKYYKVVKKANIDALKNTTIKKNNKKKVVKANLEYLNK